MAMTRSSGRWMAELMGVMGIEQQCVARDIVANKARRMVHGIAMLVRDLGYAVVRRIARSGSNNRLL